MEPGDLIYTYTDGVTEATNTMDETYGETRLSDCLNKIEETNPSTVIQSVKDSILQFTDSASQSDDITMLAFKYLGPKDNNIKTFKQEAKIENYKVFCSWLQKSCNEWNISKELANKLDLCGEEIFANISFYAYPEKNGNIEVELKISNGKLIFEFKDDGIEFNPLEKPDPDINLPPEERPIGGLGIYMVKQMVDDISYKRENNKNILTLFFNI